MGRGDKWDSWEESWPSSGAYPQPHLWRGAKAKAQSSHPWVKGAGKNKGTDKRPSFPAYDALPLTDGQPQGSARGQALVHMNEDQEGQLVPTVQRALNGARKAENRLAKLLKEKEKAQKQWAQYLQDSQKAYIRERTRHHKALDAFEKEIMEAKDQQKHARLLLRQVAFRDENEGDIEEEDDGHDNEWARMVQDWEDEQDQADDGVLQRALLESRGKSCLLGPPARTPPRPLATGPDPVGEAGSARVPTYNAFSPTLRTARTDPYPTVSPRRTAEVATGLPSEKQEDGPLDSKSSSSPLPPRERRGVKEATKTAPERPPVHGDLAEKLQARRSALMPFGLSSRTGQSEEAVYVADEPQQPGDRPTEEIGGNRPFTGPPEPSGADAAGPGLDGMG